MINTSAKFNKSTIMRRAWEMMRQRGWTKATFAIEMKWAMQDAWYEARRDVVVRELSPVQAEIIHLENKTRLTFTQQEQLAGLRRVA